MIGNSACRFRLGLGDVLLREVPLPAFAVAQREHGRRYSKRFAAPPRRSRWQRLSTDYFWGGT
jgi:hypothetical protein